MYCTRRHPHLLKLIAYCCDDEERLLVYEYMKRGNLESHLFKRFSIPLPWKNQSIHRDFKSSNILLDSDYTAKISDFWFAKDRLEGDETNVASRIMGTHGYAAPEYIMTALMSMTDV
ncbi:hypothetical protein LIER_43535 [Lithospermum erythrorhizon]|uniref:Protein kinase domain-containing protein n=1 Tax=Lithospermum erythrorhizon TaxID=34254 RepID=A0AAV3Q9P1_LITER